MFPRYQEKTDYLNFICLGLNNFYWFGLILSSLISLSCDYVEAAVLNFLQNRDLLKVLRVFLRYLL